ncbi:response regulator [Patescibacteria group bacterium]
MSVKSDNTDIDQEKKSPENKQEKSAGAKVLLVEDDPLILKMYHAKFQNEGFNVVVSEDGVHGLQMVTEQKPDIILLDIMMPQMSGIDFLKKLRATEAGKKIPVLVLTNLSEKEEEQEATTLGIKEYLLKASLTPAEIVEKVKKYV